MNISIGSYKLRLEILILIVIAFWILFGHLLCGCCKVNFMEGMAMMREGLNKKTQIAMTNMSKIEGLNKKTQIAMTNMSKTEGFVGTNNTAYGPEFAGAKSPDYIMNPSTWSLPTLTYSPGATSPTGVKAIWDRPKQPIPLPKGEMDLFATTPFKPECCPNAYSNSMGCACMTMGQYQYLNSRGSNNVPYSQY